MTVTTTVEMAGTKTRKCVVNYFVCGHGLAAVFTLLGGQFMGRVFAARGRRAISIRVKFGVTSNFTVNGAESV